jgi:propionate CoA-transferase
MGTFTVGGLKTEIKDGELHILQEGANQKFVSSVEQITFSGKFASERYQPALYVTERCVFELTKKGLQLIEIAPGIDLEKDILGQMRFEPIVEHPVLMDPRIFRDEPMGLLNNILTINLAERVTYDAVRNIMFLNLEGWSVKSTQDIDELSTILLAAFEKTGRPVNSVVNHNRFRISEDLYDHYAASIETLLERYSLSTARYTTSAFMRLKMKETLSKRGVQPHIFESGEEAHQAVLGSESKS